MNQISNGYTPFPPSRTTYYFPWITWDQDYPPSCTSTDMGYNIVNYLYVQCILENRPAWPHTMNINIITWNTDLVHYFAILRFWIFVWLKWILPGIPREQPYICAARSPCLLTTQSTWLSLGHSAPTLHLLGIYIYSNYLSIGTSQ